MALSAPPGGVVPGQAGVSPADDQVLVNGQVALQSDASHQGHSVVGSGRRHRVSQSGVKDVPYQHAASGAAGIGALDLVAALAPVLRGGQFLYLA